MNESYGSIHEQGRRLLRRHHFWIILLCAEVIIYYWAVIGTDRAVQQSIRFVLTIGLMRWIYSGSQFARFLSIALCWVGGVRLSILAGSVIDVDFFAGINIYMNALMYLLFARALIWSVPINTFLRAQSQQVRAAKRNPTDKLNID